MNSKKNVLAPTATKFKNPGMTVRLCPLVAPIILSALSGCTLNKPHWVALPKEMENKPPLRWAQTPHDLEPKEPKGLHVIEYDEHGDRWERMQVVRAASEIQRDEGGGPVIVYIHGWRNNSIGVKKDFEGFRDFIVKTRFNGKSALGIYIGWRGSLINETHPVGALATPLFPLTILNRERTADRVAGVSLASDLWQIRRAANKANRPMVIVGHSFGGRIVEGAVGNSLVSFYSLQRTESTIPKVHTNTIPKVDHDPNYRETLQKDASGWSRDHLIADLAVLINPASDSLASRQLKMALYSWPENVPPAVVAIVAKSDLAVRYAMPVSVVLKDLTRPSFAFPPRRYQLGHHVSPASKRSETQAEYRHRAAGHHEKQVWGDVAYDCEAGKFVYSKRRKESSSEIGLPHYAYLTLSVDDGILSGHGGTPEKGGVFSDEMKRLVEELVTNCLSESYTKSALYEMIRR